MTGREQVIPPGARAIRYLDILTDPRISGPHRRVQALAGEMRRMGHHPTILLPRGSSLDSSFIMELGRAGVPCRVNAALMQMRRPSLAALPHNANWLLRTLRLLTLPLLSGDEAFDCVVINGSLNAWLVAHKDLARIPAILIVNDTLVPRSVFRGIVRAAGTRLKTVFQTPSVQRFYFPRNSEEPSSADWTSSINLMPPGIDLSIFALRVARRAGTDGTFRLGSLCQVSSRKGLEDGIAAAASVAIRYPAMRVRYDIAGELLQTQATYTDTLRMIASKVPPNCQITFRGFLTREASARFLAELDCFLLTSRSESFPQVVVQAHAVGVPVVAYAIPGVVDQIKHAETGFLARPFAIDDFTGLVTRALEDAPLTDSIVLRARERSEAVFSLRSNAEKFCRIVDSVLPVSRA